MTLIERIEAASGADRELDALIGAVVSNHPTSRVIYGKGRRFYSQPDVDRIPFHVSGGKGTRWGVLHPQERYTASIDAALTLVPQGWDWNVGCQDGAWANVSPTSQPFAPEFDITIEAATPALALCAAALRAREAQQ